MRKSILSVILTLGSLFVFSQPKINQYEYWFDDQLGSKITVTVNPASAFDLNTAVDVAVLANGLHTLHIRFRDNDLKYSTAISRFFLKLNHSAGANDAITAYQYWFDEDFASQVTQTVTASPNLTLNIGIPADTLSNGLHVFHIRFRDAAGNWSQVSSRFFQKINATPQGNIRMVGYEYWFDDEYDHKITRAISSQAEFVLTDPIDATSVKQGLHTWHIRFKDNAGNRSQILSQYFYKTSDTAVPAGGNLITGFRYSLDSIYQYPTEVALPLPVASALILNDLDLSYIDSGWHIIHLQVKDTLQRWSAVTSDSFYQVVSCTGFNVSIIPSGPTTFCTGESVTLASNWPYGNSWSNGSTEPLLTVNTSGVYTLSVNNGLGCSGTASVLVAVIDDNEAPMLTCPFSILKSFCDPIASWAPPSVYDNCTQNLTPALIQGLPSGSTFPPGPTQVVYQATDENGNTGQCSFLVLVQDSIKMVVDTVLNQTGTQHNGAILITASGGAPPYSFIWKNESGVIVSQQEDATNLTAGNYIVQITDAACCTALSPQITVDRIDAASETALNEKVRLFPNPTTGIVTLQIDGLPVSEVTIEINDMNGKVVTHWPHAGLTGATYNMDFSGQHPGVYLVKIFVGETWVTKRLMVIP